MKYHVLGIFNGASIHLGMLGKPSHQSLQKAALHHRATAADTGIANGIVLAQAADCNGRAAGLGSTFYNNEQYVRQAPPAVRCNWACLPR